MVSARSETGMMATRYYYALGRSTGYAINGTRQTTIAYDSFGRVSTMSVPSGQSNNRTIEQFSWAYLPGSDLKASLQYPNGLTASWAYDANNQLLQVCNATPTNVISQFDYTYDAAGRRTAITKSGSAFGDLSGSIDSYTYNARSELISARRTKNGQPIPGFSEDFDYDPIGNRRSSATYNEKGEAQTSTYQANNLNQYTMRTTPGYAAVRGEADPNAMVTVNENPTFRLGSYYFGSDLFDNSTAGGLANLETYAVLREEKVGGGGEEENDLVSATTNQVYLAQSPETFAYDDDGNQTLITTKTGLWRVTYNGENRPVLWLRDSDNTTLVMSYDHMGRRREKNNQRFFYDGYLQVADNTGNAYAWDVTELIATRPLVWTKNGISSYYDFDSNKNVSEVVAADGSMAAHDEYAPCGAITKQRGESAAANPWRFSSEYAEDDTVTAYYNYRHYEPVMGRWLSRDPIEERGFLEEQRGRTRTLAPIHESSIWSTDVSQREIYDSILRGKLKAIKNGVVANEYLFVKNRATSGFCDLLGLHVYVCIRPVDRKPVTWIFVHAFFKTDKCGNKGYFPAEATVPNPDVPDEGGVVTEPHPEGTGGKKSRCVKVNCPCIDEAKFCQKIEESRSSGSWDGEDWSRIFHNCAHWTDMILKSQGCKGVESHFPGYWLPPAWPRY